MLAWRRPGAAHLLRRTQAGRRGGNRRRNRDALTFGLGKRLRTVGKFDPCGAPCELPGASSTNFRDPSALAHRGDGPGVGGAARTDRCWRVRLSADRANTVTNVERRNTRLYSQMVESLSYCSALESNTAVFGGPPAEGRGAVPARGAHMSGRAARQTPTYACPRMAETHGHISCVV
ncbi:hypothetical protein TcYC6_0082450 [Trypanosoma cruzi]|nr:hypothetical protein TcYC6_0001280 [Trypanosoma cruzi]KAF8297288.1 hypothetical protein TcYC6_0082450 [Trypanosoma cruzi]